MLRENLKNLINRAIVKYTFPIILTDEQEKVTSINKSNLTTAGKDEYCFKGNDNDISKIMELLNSLRMNLRLIMIIWIENKQR